MGYLADLMREQFEKSHDYGQYDESSTHNQNDWFPSKV